MIDYLTNYYARGDHDGRTEFLARTRAGRQLALRTAAGEGGTAEEGFTLIELMVVLLIMAILLAIAIPTFLSVTNGAKKTATESDLTNSLESAQALYTKTQSFPTEVPFLAAMNATQTTINYITSGSSPTKAKNVVSAFAGNATTVVFSAEDGATWCWVALLNLSSAPVFLNPTSTAPPGDSFGAYKVTPHTATTATCSSFRATESVKNLKPNFKTVTGT